MPRKAESNEQKLVTLVPHKGIKLPVTECILTKETPAEYLVQAAAKTGRGRGVKYLLRTFRIPKSQVLYLYKEEEISAEVAETYPMNGAAPVKAAAKTATASAAPKKRGRPPKAKTAADAAPKKRGRPPKAKTADAAPKKRGRPPKAKTAADANAAPKKRGRPPKAKTATDAAPKKRGRPPKAKTAADANAAPKKRGRPPKAKTAAAPKKEAAPKPAAAPKKEAAPKPAAPSKGASIFDEDF